MTDTHSTITHKTYIRELDNGFTLQAQVSPCVLMYEGYPLQLTVTLLGQSGKPLGQAFPTDRTKTAKTYTTADIQRLFDAVRVIPCSTCSAPAFDPATVKTNRDGLCETCFHRRLDAELEVVLEKERRTIARRDKRMKRKGKIVRLTAWVHPAAGGSDYQSDWYLDHRPTPQEVRDILRDAGSCVFNDYQIFTL